MGVIGQGWFRLGVLLSLSLSLQSVIRRHVACVIYIRRHCISVVAGMALLVLLVNVSLLLVPTDNTLVVPLVNVGIALLVGVVLVVAMVDVMLRVGVGSSDCLCRSVMLWL